MNAKHTLTFVVLGIKHKVYDAEFLMAVVDLLNEHGVEITLGSCLERAMKHFIASLKYNFSGQNAADKVHRDQHLQASLTILTVLAYKTMDTEFASMLMPRFSQPLAEALRLLNQEN